MNLDPSINHILEYACPSIQYRIRKELLHHSTSHPEMIALQDRICQDAAVLEVISWQQPDGWLAWAFHGYESLETGIRLLCEKGVEPDHPVLARALLALESATDRLERGFGKVGKILDELDFGGAQTVQAVLCAHAGHREIPLVHEQVRRALAVFKSALDIGSKAELYEMVRGRPVYRAGIRWPGIYHLRLLAFTCSWRTQENRKLLLESIQHMLRLLPLPNIHVRYKSQLIAPASFGMDNFTPDMQALPAARWMPWFHRMELFARLGILDRIPELNKQVLALAGILQMGQGLFIKKLQHPYFHKWGSYTGLMLERDWKLPRRRISDLTFRSLLILKSPQGSS